MNDNFPVPGCRIERITRDSPELLHVAAHGTKPNGHCPDCGRASRAVHSHYRRCPADLPLLGSQVRVGLRVRRFYCRNTACARQTFAERLPDLVAPHARRTGRLAEAQTRVGVALGGEAGSRLMCRLAMPASAATVLRLVRRPPLPETEPPRAVGVDDWAIRKGRTYGTIVVDLERRRVIDLLPDRTAETLAGWLQQRPGIAIVARDRSTEYARGIALGAPDAVQVCDRWHRLANMRQAVERWLHGAHARLRRLPVPPAGAEGATPVPVRRGRAFRRSGPERAASAASRARRRARYDEVRRRHLAGEPLLAIARATGLARATVRKHARAESFPEWAAHGPRRSIIDPYLPYLERRVAEGCDNGVALWHELRAQGFSGGAKQVHRWLAERRTTPAKSRWRVCGPDAARRPAARSTGAALPAPRRLAWSLVQPIAMLGAAETAAIARVEQDEESRTVAGLARRFTALVRACGAQSRQGGSQIPAEPTAALDAWLAEARACGASTIETFAAGLETDGAAVRAALTHAWSSGQGEGQVTRLKLLKRQSYGRAGFDLLRRRVLLTA
jgi:transposase